VNRDEAWNLRGTDPIVWLVGSSLNSDVIEGNTASLSARQNQVSRGHEGVLNPLWTNEKGWELI
jgi:hypothetical protein